MVYPSKRRYDQLNLIRVCVAFNRKTDKEMAEFMEGIEGKPAYLRKLVREDLDRRKREGKEKGTPCA